MAGSFVASELLGYRAIIKTRCKPIWGQNGMADPDTLNNQLSWQSFEEIAGLLEKSLTPTAKVRRNVFLPVLGTTRTRQCDLVITDGSPLRQSVTIVEVQNRNHKPNINTFHGWYKKMQEVGAQHLICVSRQGYPRSIIDEVANRIGPTVRLLTLAELRELEVPGFHLVSPFVLHRNPQFTFERIDSVKLENPPIDITSLDFESTDKVFTLGEGLPLLTIVDVVSLAISEVSNALVAQGMELPDRCGLDLCLGSIGTDFRVHMNGVAHKIAELPIKVRVDTTISKIPLTFLEYRQESIDGALAWVAVAETYSEGKKLTIRYVFRKNSDGLLRDVSIQAEGVESAGLVVSTDKIALEEYVRRNLKGTG